MSNTSRSPKVITVFGASGFLGRHVTRALAKRGYRVRAAVRRPDLAGHLQPLGDVGQITAIQANLRHRWSVERALDGADGAVNLVGILFESGRQSFNAVQEFGARAVAQSCAERGLPLVHVSAIGADENSDAEYARTKARGEKVVKDALGKNAIIMRPSIVFGPEDNFFNKFANMARISPVLPLIGGGTTKFQPVYVADVAEAIAKAIDGDLKGGMTYELGGPEVLTFKQCLETTCKVIERKRAFVNLPWFIARINARFMGLLPNPILTVDQVQLLQSDNVVTAPHAQTLEGMGIKAASLDAILPTYLWRFRETGQFRNTHAIAEDQ